MRIVVVTTSFPRTEDDPAGHFVRSSARALARAGHHVHVIAPGGSLLDPPHRRGELLVHRAGGSSLFAWPGAAARLRQAPLRIAGAATFAVSVAARLRAIGRVDRAVAHWIVPCAWPLLMRADAPLDAFAHGGDVRMLLAAPTVLREHVVGSLVERGTRFTFAARASLDALATSLPAALAGALRFASHVDPPPIDVPDVAARAAELRASLDLSPGERLAVVACRLVASKRAELAVDAAKEARGQLRLVVVGDGPARPSLEERAKGADPKVRFTGGLPRREALAWIAAADVLIHPSAFEAAPTVVREARALGVRVVACDAGDVASWAQDDPGIRVAGASAAAIGAEIARS